MPLCPLVYWAGGKPGDRLEARLPNHLRAAVQSQVEWSVLTIVEELNEFLRVASWNLPQPRCSFQCTSACAGGSVPPAELTLLLLLTSMRALCSVLCRASLFSALCRTDGFSLSWVPLNATLCVLLSVPFFVLCRVLPFRRTYPGPFQWTAPVTWMSQCPTTLSSKAGHCFSTALASSRNRMPAVRQLARVATGQ